MDLDLDPRVWAELARQAGDGIAFRARRNHVHHTWARTFSSLPELYVQPESVEEVAKVVGLARACRRRVVVAGCGHSPSDLTCTSSWLVNLDGLNRLVAVDAEAGVVVVQAGMRLWELGATLDRYGLAMPSLGSIDQQSLAGALATATHGSSLRHGLLSENVLSLRLMLSDGRVRSCSASEDAELFAAALVSLGALGIVVEVTFRAVPAFRLRWRQTIDRDSRVLRAWNENLWTQAEFVRVWWFPHTRRAVVWTADKTDDALRDPRRGYYDGRLGYYVYHNLLYLSNYFPRILPWVEWFVFGMQYGFRNGDATAVTAVQPSRQALLMNCLYSQFVNEWALPLDKGPEALARLGSWLNRLTPDHADYVPHNIPFPNDAIYVHAPVEVRVADTSLPRSPLEKSDDRGVRPLLDPTRHDGPTLYLNATLYRPYHRDPPCRARYYQAFEWLMRDLGGRPHWAKNFAATAADMELFYGESLRDWREIRHRHDPDGMFVGPWHRRVVLGDGPLLDLEEVEIDYEPAEDGGVLFTGTVMAV